MQPPSSIKRIPSRIVARKKSKNIMKWQKIIICYGWPYPALYCLTFLIQFLKTGDWNIPTGSVRFSQHGDWPSSQSLLWCISTLYVYLWLELFLKQNDLLSLGLFYCTPWDCAWKGVNIHSLQGKQKCSLHSTDGQQRHKDIKTEAAFLYTSQLDTDFFPSEYSGVLPVLQSGVQSSKRFT